MPGAADPHTGQQGPYEAPGGEPARVTATPTNGPSGHVDQDFELTATFSGVTLERLALE